MLEVIIGILGFLGLMMVLIAYDALTWGLVGYKFWYWFLMPIFPTLPAIVFWQAVGMMFFIGLFKINLGQAVKKEYRDETAQAVKKEYRDETAQAFAVIVYPWIMLLCGWIAYAWIIPKLAH